MPRPFSHFPLASALLKGFCSELDREEKPIGKEIVMGFYGSEPFDKAQAWYVWTGLNEPGHFLVEVEGCAPNYTTGITLVRDSHFVGGLKVDVMGWTGPRAQGCTDYKVNGTFSGEFRPQIVVAGSNKQEVVKVQEIPADKAEAFLDRRRAA